MCQIGFPSDNLRETETVFCMLRVDSSESGAGGVAATVCRVEVGGLATHSLCSPGPHGSKGQVLPVVEFGHTDGISCRGEGRGSTDQAPGASCRADAVSDTRFVAGRESAPALQEALGVALVSCHRPAPGSDEGLCSLVGKGVAEDY